MGKKSDPPAQPSAASLAGDQLGVNLTSQLQANKFNTFDQFAPWGSTVWIRDKQGNPVGQSLLLGKDQLRNYNQGVKLQGGLGSAALGQLRHLPSGKMNFSGIGFDPRDTEVSNTLNMGDLPEWLDGDTLTGARNQVQDALYERSMSLQRPEWDRQYQQMNTELVNRGIPINSEIDTEARRKFYTGQNEAQQRAALDAISGGRDELMSLFGMNAQQRAQTLGEQQALGAEQSRVAGLEQALRQQGINEYTQRRYEPINLISSFMQGGPAMPTASFMPQPNYSAAPPDFMGAAMNNYATQMQDYNSQRNSTNSGLYGLGSALLGGGFGDTFGNWLFG